MNLSGLLNKVSLRVLLSIISATLLWISHPQTAFSAESSSVNVDELKVAYIYNFTKYFTWTDEDKWNESDTFNLCINTGSVAGAQFSNLNGETTHGKSIRIISIDEQNRTINQQCHLWYVDSKQYEKNKPRLEELKGSDVLTISDSALSSREHIVIELVVVSNRLKFRANRTLIENKNLAVNSSLLALALP